MTVKTHLIHVIEDVQLTIEKCRNINTSNYDEKFDIVGYI